jgi:hypothetical protein
MPKRSIPQAALLSALALLAATVTLLASAGGARAATPPIKEILSSHIGWEANATTKANICTVQSQNTCQKAKPSTQPGGFQYPKGVAVDGDVSGSRYGDVYVADSGNHRVQVLSPTGEFVGMFGTDVNETNGADICTENEITTAHVKCKEGVKGPAPGQLGESLRAVAVDPSSGDVYTAEEGFGPGGGSRVQEFTAEGAFVLEIGKEVNETTKDNLCTEEEIKEQGVKCRAPVETDTPEPGAFVPPGGPEALAVGGPQDLLYVGDEHRVQEFEADGEYKGEISLTSISSAPASIVHGIAVDKAGDVYVTYEDELTEATNVVHEFAPDGSEVKTLTVPGVIQGIALDPAGRLAVIEGEEEGLGYRGALYEVGATGLRLITNLTSPPSKGIAFGGEDQLYSVGDAGTGRTGHELIAYVPVPVGELLGAPEECAPGVEHESDATLDCVLHGEVDAWGVKETQVFFQWGRTAALGEVTTPPSLIANVDNLGEEEPVAKVGATVEGLRPDETFHYRLAGEDENVKTPELLTSETVSFATQMVAPQVVGEPSAVYETSSSAVVFGELNPENANTAYEFQYGACPTLESCPEMLSTTASESAVYGTIGTTVEVTGLQPATAYRYRLVASNEGEVAGKRVGGSAMGVEGTFTTSPAPVPQARTGAVNAVGVTTATASGTVNPDGQPATYEFELGVYAGAATQYGIAFSGAAGAGTLPVTETLGITGLQPGTTYAYRIKIASGYGTDTGEPVLFTTEGLPAVLGSPPPLAQLAIPDIAFPATTTQTKNGAAAKPKRKRTRSKRKAKKTKRPRKPRR